MVSTGQTPADVLDNRVRDWLEDNGAALELRTARALRRAGFSAQHSARYQDDIEGTMREVDVVAPWRNWTMFGGFALELVVECKASNVAPWILLESEHTLPQTLVERMITGHVTGSGPDAGTASPADTVAIDCPLLAPGYAASFVYSAKAALPANKPDVVYQAVTQVLAAARGRVTFMASDLQDKTESTFVLAIPIIVTAAPLFVAGLDGADEIKRRQVSHALLLHQNGVDPDDRSAVWIFSADDLDELAARAHTTAQGLTVTRSRDCPGFGCSYWCQEAILAGWVWSHSR